MPGNPAPERLRRFERVEPGLYRLGDAGATALVHWVQAGEVGAAASASMRHFGADKWSREMPHRTACAAGAGAPAFSHPVKHSAVNAYPSHSCAALAT